MNNNDIPPKQINRIATPIKVDELGNKIEEQKKVVLEKKELPKKNDSKVTFIIVIILIILAIISAILFYFIIPYLEKNKNNYKFNDVTTKEAIGTTYNFFDINISETNYISALGDYIINEDFTITLTYSPYNTEILINGKTVANAKYLLSKIGFVDDLILIMTQNEADRTTKLYAVDKDGNIVYELYDIEGIDGLVLSKDNSSVTYSSATAVVRTSRVKENIIYIDSSYGSDVAIDICNTDQLDNNSISLTSTAISNYSVEYLGNHKFGKPKKIYSMSIEEYIKENNLCQ